MQSQGSSGSAAPSMVRSGYRLPPSTGHYAHPWSVAVCSTSSRRSADRSSTGGPPRSTATRAGHGSGPSWRPIALWSRTRRCSAGSTMSVAPALPVDSLAINRATPCRPLSMWSAHWMVGMLVTASRCWQPRSLGTPMDSIGAGLPGRSRSTRSLGWPSSRSRSTPQTGDAAGPKRALLATTSRVMSSSSTSQGGRPSRSASPSDRRRPGGRALRLAESCSCARTLR